MFKIGEFSKLTKISVRMLHHYDKEDILKPSLTDEKTGYRYYDISQVEILQRIVMLRDFDFSLSEIKDLLNNWSNDYLVQKMKIKIDEKKFYITKQKEQIKAIEYAIENVDKNKVSLQYNVVVKNVPQQQVISIRQKIENHFVEYQLWEKLSSYVDENKINIINSNTNNIAIYHDLEYKETQVDVEVCFVVHSKGKDTYPFVYQELPSVKLMASMMVHGSYEKIDDAYQSFLYWLEEHPHFRVDGLSRQVCHRDHTNESDPNNYITEIQIPVSKEY